MAPACFGVFGGNSYKKSPKLIISLPNMLFLSLSSDKETSFFLSLSLLRFILLSFELDNVLVLFLFVSEKTLTFPGDPF